MGYEISISANNEYLRVLVNEALSVELLTGFINDAANKSIKYGINGFLFDLRSSSNQVSLGTHYEFVYKRSRELGFKPSSKHALLVNPNDVNDYRFVETILLNAGYQGKMFIDEADAIEWLESEIA